MDFALLVDAVAEQESEPGEDIDLINGKPNKYKN